jgi:hypothetical protein
MGMLEAEANSAFPEWVSQLLVENDGCRAKRELCLHVGLQVGQTAIT